MPNGAEDVRPQRPGQLALQRQHARFHRDEHRRVTPWIGGQARVVVGEPLLGELDHLLEHRRGRRRTVHHRPGEVAIDQQDRGVRGGHERQVCELALQERLFLDAHDVVQRVGIAGVAKLLLRPEVVPNQPSRDARRPGDVPDRRAVDPAFGEQAKRRVPDPRSGRQVLERRLANRARHQRHLLYLRMRSYSKLLTDYTCV